jgi:cytochrome c peroxidase
MKRIALFAALAALVALPAWAQSTQPAAKASEKKATAPLKVNVKPDAKMEAGMPAASENIKPLHRELTKRSYLDARECLNKKTNEEIIICAEKFL